MKIRELLAIISYYDPDAEVLVESGSSVRVMNKDDTRYNDGAASDGDPLETDDGDEVTGPILTITTWGLAARI